MDLWIRSQDKECLTKVNHLYFNNNGYIKQQEDLILGTYKSKERALEILDEIQNLLNDISDNKIVGCVYQMPKD